MSAELLVLIVLVLLVLEVDCHDVLAEHDLGAETLAALLAQIGPVAGHVLAELLLGVEGPPALLDGALEGFRVGGEVPPDSRQAGHRQLLLRSQTFNTLNSIVLSHNQLSDFQGKK